MTKPISPKEALNARVVSIPPLVIEVVNALLIEKFSSSSGIVSITQAEIQSRILKKRTSFNMSWLDFEPLYREVGWDVVYHKSDWNDVNEKSYFQFRPLPTK